MRLFGRVSLCVQEPVIFRSELCSLDRLSVEQVCSNCVDKCTGAMFLFFLRESHSLMRRLQEVVGTAYDLIAGVHPGKRDLLKELVTEIQISLLGREPSQTVEQLSVVLLLPLVLFPPQLAPFVQEPCDDSDARWNQDRPECWG
jgi:hypothetical protein